MKNKPVLADTVEIFVVNHDTGPPPPKKPATFQMEKVIATGADTTSLDDKLTLNGALESILCPAGSSLIGTLSVASCPTSLDPGVKSVELQLVRIETLCENKG